MKLLLEKQAKHFTFIGLSILVGLWTRVNIHLASLLHNSNRKTPFHQQINCGENIHLAQDLLWKHRSIFNYSPLLSNDSLTNKCFLSKKSGILNAQLFASSVNILCNNTKVNKIYCLYLVNKTISYFLVFVNKWALFRKCNKKSQGDIAIVSKHIYKKSSILPSKHQFKSC